MIRVTERERRFGIYRKNNRSDEKVKGKELVSNINLHIKREKYMVSLVKTGLGKRRL